MSVKKNFFYNTLLTCSTYMFSLLTYPYVSRVLGVSNIGICNYVTSIVGLFTMFASMGINMIGTREIAKCNGDNEKISSCFYSLFYINMTFTIIVSVIYFFCINMIPQLMPYKKLLYVGLIQIIFTPFLIEWFFRGIEDFRYITIRSIAIKIFYVVAVFLFIKTPDDYQIFFTFTCAMTVLNVLFNWHHKRMYVSYKIAKIEYHPYIKGFLILGLYFILGSMYSTFTTALLGFVGDDKEVGLFTTATKLQGIILSLYTAFTGVVMPRMSAYISQGNTANINNLIKKSFDCLFVFSIPTVFLSIIYSPHLIAILAGKGYEEAILPMRIIMPLIFVVGMEQVLVVQILLPQKKDNAILLNSIVGGGIGLIANLILTSTFLCLGAAIVTLLAEVSVLIMSYYSVFKKYGNVIPFVELLKSIIVTIPAIPVLLIFTKINSVYLSLVSAFIFMIIYILIVQVKIVKNLTVIGIISQIRNKIYPC